MSSYTTLQNNFPSGEISPLWKGKSNTDFYRTGLNLCHNFMPMLPSGLRRRPGTKIVSNSTEFNKMLIVPIILNGDKPFYLQVTTNKIYCFKPNTSESIAETSHSYSQLVNANWAFNKNAVWFVKDDMKPVKLSITYTSDTDITLSIEEPTFTGDMTFSTEGNYPSVVAFKGGRLLLGGTKNTPNAIFCSNAPDYSDEANPDRYTTFLYADVTTEMIATSDETFKAGKTYYKRENGVYTEYTTRTGNPLLLGLYEKGEIKNVVSSNAIEIEDNELPKPLWFINSKHLLIGSSKCIFSDNSSAITPTTFFISPSAREGASPIPAKALKNYVLYAGVSNKTMSLMIYNYEAQQYITREITTNSSHLFASGIKDFTICFMPQPIIWVITNDNSLLSCSVDLSTGEFYAGWAKHNLGNGKPLLETVTSVQNENGEDTLYIQCRYRNRTGAWIGYGLVTLQMNDIFNYDSSTTYLDFVRDVSLGSPSTMFAYTSKDVGNIVTVIADGEVIPKLQLINEGAVSYFTLDKPARNVIVGVPIESLVGFLSQEQPANGQTSFGCIRRLKSTVLRVFQSFGGYIGTQYQDLSRMYKLLSERYGNSEYDKQITLTDDDIHTDLQGVNSDNANLYVYTDFPTPLNILALKEHIELLEV